MSRGDNLRQLEINWVVAGGHLVTSRGNLGVTWQHFPTFGFHLRDHWVTTLLQLTVAWLVIWLQFVTLGHYFGFHWLIFCDN